MLCSRCGLEREITDYDYSAFYSVEANLYRAPTETEYEVRAASVRYYIDFIKSKLPNPGRCLEIGCNAGYLMKNIKEEGWDISGIDLNPPAIQFAEKKGLKVRCETLESANFKDHSFDFVLLVHTLEHLPNASDCLKMIHRILAPLGYFFVVVPNSGASFCRILDAKHPGCYIPGQHIWYFNKKTLECTMESFGFHKVTLRTMDRMTADTHRKFPFARSVKKALVKTISVMDWGSEIAALFQKIN